MEKLSYYIDFYNNTYMDSNIDAIKIKSPLNFTLTFCKEISETEMAMLAPFLEKEVSTADFLNEDGSIIMKVVFEK